MKTKLLKKIRANYIIFLDTQSSSDSPFYVVKKDYSQIVKVNYNGWYKAIKELEILSVVSLNKLLGVKNKRAIKKLIEEVKWKNTTEKNGWIK